jgi:outer membrane protein TolC
MLAEASVRTARASLERLAIIDRDLHNLYQSGLADSVDILDAMLALEKGRQVVEQQETIYRNASLALATLIGLDAAGGLVPNEAVEPPSSPDVSDSAAITRYEISQIDRRIRAAELGAGLSQAEYYPSVSGFGGYSVGKPNRDMFEKSWNDYFSAGVVLTWAINTGGTTGKAVAAARQTALSARMARAELLEALRLQSQTARNNLEQAFRTVQVIANERDIARRQYRLAGDQQRAGQLSVNRLLELETSLTTTEQQYQAALIQYYLADGDYLYAVGSPKIFGGLR